MQVAEAIKDWVLQVFRDASRKNKEVYFGLKREYMEYDDVFSNVIAARCSLVVGGILSWPSTPPVA